MNDIPTGVWYVVGIIVTGIVGVLFGKNNLKRDSSATRVAEAQDTQQIGFINAQSRELQDMERRREKDADRIEKLLAEIQRLKDEATAKQLAESKAAVEQMQKQVTKALAEVEPDKVAALVMESGFLNLDRPLRAAPIRPPPTLTDPYQANVVYGRRSTDSLDELRKKFPSQTQGWTAKDDA